MKRLCLCLLAVATLAPAGDADPIDLDRFRMIPVFEGSRKMPMDTFARHQVLGLRGRPLHGETPVSWMARMLFDPASTETDNLFVLDHPDVASDAGITAEPDHRRYRYTDVTNAIPRLIERAQAAEQIPRKHRTQLERETIRFTRAILHYQYLRNSLEFAQDTIVVPESMRERLGIDREKASYHELSDNEALRAFGIGIMSKTELTDEDREGIALISSLQRISEIMDRVPFPFNVVPLDPHAGSERWTSPVNAIPEARQFAREGDPELSNCVAAWVKMQRGYAAGDQALFDAGVDEHLSFIGRRLELRREASGASDRLAGLLGRLRGAWSAFLLLGTGLMAALVFGPARWRWWPAGALVALLSLSAVVLSVRLYGGTEMSTFGLVLLGLSLAMTLAGGVALIFRPEPFWRGFGGLVAGLVVLGGIGIGAVALFGEWKIEASSLAVVESLHNRIQPFYWTMFLYVIAFLVSFAGLLTRNRWVIRSSIFLVAVALLFHVGGIELRMFITARPPVTNLYATFPVVALGCMLLALAVELFLRNGIGVLCGTFCGWVLLLLSGVFAREDTLNTVEPVLASQFWLSTHVITIIFGYIGVFLAGVIAHLYLVFAGLGIGTRKAMKSFFRVMLGVLAFGLVFSFLGTMLGGVWADQSWGRFWGWDPKENGALLIVIWCALTYHARLANLIREVGVAAMTAFGCVVVMIGWLGLNQLGVGLHSYGFTSGLATWLLSYFAAEAVLVTGLAVFARRRLNRNAPAVPVPAT